MPAIRLRLLGVVLVLGVLACDDGLPTPGRVTVSLVTPNSDDGAVAVTVTGSGLDEVRAASSSHRLYWRLAEAGRVRVLVFGNLGAGPIFTVEVGDVGTLSGYTGTVTEVARRNDDVREDLSGYDVTLAVVEQ